MSRRTVAVGRIVAGSATDWDLDPTVFPHRPVTAVSAPGGHGRYRAKQPRSSTPAPERKEVSA